MNRSVLSIAAMIALAVMGCGSVGDDDCVPAVQLVDGQAGSAPAGLERCGDAWNRVAAVDLALDSRLDFCDRDRGDGCAADTDCGGDQGCVSGDGCFCTDVCRNDDNCAADEACVGGAIADGRGVVGAPQCVPATCRGPDDCDNADCGVQVVCGTPIGLSCRAAFECVDDDDCPFNGFCVANEDGPGWSCSYEVWTCE